MRALRALLPCAALLGLSACATLQITELQKSADKPSNVAVYFKVVQNNGDPVPGLTADSFTIYEDEKPVSKSESQQTILNPEVAASHYTLLLVDMSGSVSGEDGSSEQVIQAADVFASRVETNNFVAIYAFDGSEDIHKLVPFAKAQEGKSRAERIGAFAAEDPSTNLNGAVVQGLEVLDEVLEDAKTPLKFGTLVVFSDGTDRAARVSEDDMVTAVGDTDHDVFAIGLGSEISEKDLGRIGKDGTTLATDKAAVTQAFDEIAAKIEGLTKSYYLLSYCSPARAGAHEVTIEAEAKVGDKTKKGKLDSSFDAEGFDKGCDPSTPPKFDVTQGDALVADEE